MAQDYYKILGVEKNASQDDIKSAYRKLVKQYHPDLHPNDPNAAAKFKEINEANEILSDPEKRRQYDYELEHPGAFQGGAGGFGGFSDFGGSGGFSDLFGDFFSAFTGGGRSSSSARQKGQDIELEMTLSFLDAAKGCTKEFTYQRKAPCSSCNGTGAKGGTSYTKCSKCNGTGVIQQVQGQSFFRTVTTRPCPDCGGTGKKITEKCSVCAGKGYTSATEKITLNIPAGADTNSYIQKKKMGHASAYGGEAGDLIVVFKVTPHKIFKRKEYDLYVELPISFKTACLGGKVKVPTLDDAYVLDIPEETQTGRVFVIRGKGIKGRYSSGNLYVTVVVETPKKLTKQQKTKLEEVFGSVDLKQNAKMSDYDRDMQTLYGEKPYEN